MEVGLDSARYSLKGSFGKREGLVAVSLIFFLLVMALASVGFGTIPALGSAFNPATGVWSIARTASLPTTTSLNLRGLNYPVTVSFSKDGVPYIYAENDHDLFMAIGYLQATDRLFEMDVLKREASGGLTQILGPGALNTDKLELTLGLGRTASAEWASIDKAGGAVKADLLAFSSGVNDRIAQDEASGNLPVEFKLLKYTPAPWTPVSSLLIQGDLTQQMDFTTTPIDYSLLARAVGYTRAMQLFPVNFPNQQNPYDPGPYRKLPPVPLGVHIPGTTPVIAPSQGSATSAAYLQTAKATSSGKYVSAVDGSSIKTIESWISSTLPPMLRLGSASNNFAVMGVKSSDKSVILEGDPHLDQTLPAIWYQLVANSPDIHIAGVSVPGLPGILIGRNQTIAWSLTDSQDQAAFFYQEVTSKARPNEYFWRGKWYQMKIYHYAIKEKGGGSVPYTVKVTVHGPLLTQNGMALSVDWMGALPTNDLGAMFGVYQSTSYSQFRNALRGWKAPTLNFIYGDKSGNVGIISAGVYGVTKASRPWLPMSGSGGSDIIGAIPFSENPQTYDPPSHFVFSANQRPVRSNYPYYIGTTANFFATGYRANIIHNYLARHKTLSTSQAISLELSVKDFLASEIVPKLLKVLNTTVGPAGGALGRNYSEAIALLKGWNYRMDANSPSATIWWYFWANYLNSTFGPLWKSASVPTGVDPALKIGPNMTPLDVVLEQWTLNDKTIPLDLGAPGQPVSISSLMTQAFSTTVGQLTSKLGANPNNWQWDRVHFRQFPSLTFVGALGYGPRGSSGDIWTVNAADGTLTSKAGPSWRMIVNFNHPSYAVYPGGQSENPLSNWYENDISLWWNGKYRSFSQELSRTNTLATWTLLP